MMPGRDRDKGPLILILLGFSFFAATMFAVIRFINREPEVVGGVFAKRAPSETATQAAPATLPPQAAEPRAGAPDEAVQPANLPLVGGSWRDRQARGEASAPAPAPVAAKTPDMAPAMPATPAAAPVALSQQEHSLIESMVGKWNDAAAFALGSDGPRLFKLGEVLLRYPRVVGAILNNPFLVKGFMSSGPVQKRCKDPQTLVSYMSNTKDPNGIRLAIKTFATSLNTPDSTSTIFGSKLVAAVLDNCPAIQTVAHDPDSVGQIATADNGVLALMTNPAFVTALAANPAALGTFNAVQTSMPGTGAGVKR
jgi:hypothetical protein